MASIAKRTQAGKVTWLARWRDPAGVERKRSFGRKVDATRFLATVESSMLSGSYVDPAAGRVTFAAQAERWRAGKVALASSTLASYDAILRTHLLPRWGSVPLDRIGHEDVTAWVAQMTASRSASRTRQATVVLRQVLDSAVKAGRLARNPATAVELPRLRRSDKRFLTHEQVARLADAAGRDGALVRFLAYTGLRWSEVVALRVRRVDLLRGRVEVAEGATEVGGLVFDDPKSHRRRSTPVPRFLRDELAAACAGKGADDFVFTAPRGGPLRYAHWRRRVWQPATAAAGLDGLGVHELRHTAASLGVSAGASVKGIQAMLGHASAAMTLDVYAGLFADELDAVAERLDDARSKVVAAAVPYACPKADVVDLESRRATS
jgi:integrase